MRFEQVQPSTTYATCDRRMVITDDDIIPYYEQRNHRREFGPEQPGAGDPWSKCTTGGRPSVRYVRATAWTYDQHGNPLNEIGVTHIRPSDIGGPWDAFVLLHAEQVAFQGWRSWADGECRRQAEELQDMVASRGFKDLRVEVCCEVLLTDDKGQEHWEGLYQRVINSRAKFTPDLEHRFVRHLSMPNKAREESDRLLGMIQRQRKVTRLHAVGDDQ